MMAQPAHDPSRHSYYLDDALYRELIADFDVLRSDDPTIQDLAERELFRGLLEREARLLDRLQFQEWLRFYAGE